MATKNTGVKGVLEDYRRHLQQQQEILLKEAMDAVKMGSSLRVEQEDYTFGVKKDAQFHKNLLTYVDDEQYLFYVENDEDYLFLVMEPENDHELVCDILSILVKKHNLKCIVYNSQLIDDKTVMPMIMKGGNIIPCFLRRYQHQVHEKEDLDNIMDNAEQLLQQYGMIKE